MKQSFLKPRGVAALCIVVLFVISKIVVESYMDEGYFVPNRTPGPVVVDLTRPTSLNIFVFEPCKRHSVLLSLEDGQEMNTFPDTFDRLAPDNEPCCLVATETLGPGTWIVNTDPTGLELVVLDRWASMNRYHLKFLHGWLQKLCVLLLIALGIWETVHIRRRNRTKDVQRKDST